MKIFDCFMFNDENLILDIRFNVLDKYISKFVIVEAAFDHQGNKKKKLNFKIKDYKKYKDKIIYKVVKSFPKKSSNWERENFQRNFILNGLNEAGQDDYIIISDVDEIPNLSNLKSINKFKYTIFEQKMFYYKLNLINKSNPIWMGSKMCKKKYLKSPQWLRNQKVKPRTFWKFYRIKWNHVKDGGWHFSFLMSPKDIQKKIKSFAHAEFNSNAYTNIEKIKFSIKNSQDLFGRDIKFKKIKFDKTYPEYIFNNRKKFKNWII